MKIHPDVTVAKIVDACERHQTTLDNPGFCIACGVEAEGVDPDARGDECDECDAMQVYGAQELMLYVA
jgi:hypothetical protein